MRILYSHRIQSRDGQSVHVEEIVGALRRLGHQVLVVGPAIYGRATFGGESRALAFIRRHLPRAALELAELAYNIPAALQLWRACRDFRPDLIYERYNLYFLAGTMVARWHKRPLFLEVNAPVCEERARFGGLALTSLARRAQRTVWRSADRVFAVTEALKRLVVAAGVSDERVLVVPNGIDPATFSVEPQLTPRGGTVTIGFIGFVRDWHGLDRVIEHLADDRADPPIRLVIVGDGPARPQLQRQAAASGLGPHVRFLGVQPRAAIPGLIRGFDIALQPRVVPYASPLKIFEYMACGRAIVAPDQANIREILTDGETALLFDPDDPAALWRAIRRLAGDPELREALGRAARHAIDAGDYTWRRNALRIIAAADALRCRDGVATAGDPAESF